MLEVTRLLKELGVEFKQASRDEVVTRCWNPNHRDSTPSLNINLETGVFHCLGCHIKGNLLTIINHHTGLTGWDSQLFLKEFIHGGFTDEQITDHLHEELKKRKKEPNLVRTIIDIPSHIRINTHPYLEQRGILPLEIKEWKMGVVHENFSTPNYKYNGWIIIPIFFQGMLRNYFLRSTTNNGKIYGAYPRTDILFGLDSCTKYEQPLYIVEGIFDMIYFRRTRAQCVAALSNRLLPEQREHLKKYKKIVIVPDNDDPGMWLVYDAKELIHNVEISVVYTPQHDSASCTLDELLESRYYELPIEEVIISRRYQEWCSKQSGLRSSRKLGMTHNAH